MMICEGTRNGKPERFMSKVIPLDSTVLAFKLDFQKKTNLYVDRRDGRNYYFDVGFLYE
jgi:hypothetical protein